MHNKLSYCRDSEHRYHKPLLSEMTEKWSLRCVYTRSLVLVPIKSSYETAYQ